MFLTEFCLYISGVIFVILCVRACVRACVCVFLDWYFLRIISLPDPPIFMPSIIFFIMSSISREGPPRPKEGPPRPKEGIGPPLEDVIVEEDEDEELANDIEDLLRPSGDSVVAAISWDAEEES